MSSYYNIRDLEKPRYSDHAIGFYRSVQDKADGYDCVLLPAEGKCNLASVHYAGASTGEINTIFGLDVITANFVEKPLLCNKEDVFQTT